jgi:hypothetical protein
MLVLLPTSHVYQNSPVHHTLPRTHRLPNFRHSPWHTPRPLDLYHRPRRENTRSPATYVRSQEVSPVEYNICCSRIVSFYSLSCQMIDFVLPLFNRDHEALYCRHMFCRDWNWIWQDEPPPELEVPGRTIRARCQFRHIMPDVECTVIKETWVYSSSVRLALKLMLSFFQGNVQGSSE